MNFFLEIIKNDKVVARAKKILNELSWSNELMYVPATDILLPIEYASFFSGREEVKVYVNGKVFHGIVTSFELNKVNETISINIAHVVSEWAFRQISTNHAIKNRTFGNIYTSNNDFRFDNTWNISFLNGSATRNVDYVYSRQNKLEGLTKTCELTDDLFWRVGFCQDVASRTIEVGSFGIKKPYIFSTKPSARGNIRIISEPVIKHEFENVINVAVVYGEKSDSGMSSMSLREVYNNIALQIPKFPIVIHKTGINNERTYGYFEYPKLAPNNETEYGILDVDSIALESGTVIEGSFAFNDLSPFNIDSKEVKDADRIVASKTAYDAAVKRLKQSRRTFSIELTTEELPCDVYPGDQIRLIYDNKLLITNECSNYLKKILTLDDWYYVTSIQFDIDKNGVETNSVTLEKFLKTSRETSRE